MSHILAAATAAHPGPWFMPAGADDLASLEWRGDPAEAPDMAAVAAAVAAYTPPGRRRLTPREFRERLTGAEQHAMLAAAFGAPDPATRIAAGTLLLRAAEAQEIDLDNPEVAAGLDHWVAAGVLDPARKAALLADV